MDIDFKLQCNIINQDTELDGILPSVKNAITVIAKDEGYISHKIYKTAVSSVGGNCFGDLYEINIIGETKEGNKETNIFVKQVIPSADNFKLFSVSEIYCKEAFLYKEVATIFTNLQDKANIPLNNRFKFVKSYDVSNSDALLLENLSKKGFKTYYKTDVMNLNYAEVCLEHLAKLHGLTFLIEKTMPNYFESKIKSVQQSIIVGEDYKEFVAKNYEVATAKLSSDIKSKVDKWWSTAIEEYEKCINGIKTDAKCLCHGDFKMNNILHKEIDGEIKEVIAIDYQLAHYGSPVLDVIFFISMGTDKEFRRKHMVHLKNHYHDALKTYLAYFNTDVEDVYPKKMFENDFENCLDYAVVVCLVILPYVLTTEENVDVGDTTKIIHEGLKLDDIYYDRIQGVIEDFLKYFI